MRQPADSPQLFTWGLLRAFVNIAVVAMVVAVVWWVISQRTPPGRHFILMNETEGPLRKVRMVFPWGEYMVKEIGPTTYLPFHH